MRSRVVAGAVAIAAVGFLLMPHASAQTGDVHVLASNGVKALLEALVPQAERAIGRHLVMEFNTSAALKPRIESGEAFDVTVMTSDVLDDLVKAGKIAAGTSVGVARSGIGVGIRTGAPKPDISTPESLKRTLLNAGVGAKAKNAAAAKALVKFLSSPAIAPTLKAKGMEPVTVKTLQ